jgi:LysR family transcriptional regulator, nitrogen assimilation regulatory protein
MELRALKSFVRVADLGSITRAATELAIVQPALSRQIQRIEEELGAALLTRLPRGVQLTGAGRQFLEYARRILREVDDARAALLPHTGERGEHVRGRVALGLSPTLAPVVGPGCIERIQRQLPGVELRVFEAFSGPLGDRLANGQLDIALLTNPTPARRLRMVPLIAEDMVVVTSPRDHDTRRFYGFDELASTSLLMTPDLRALADAQLRKHGVRLNAASEIESVETIRRLLLRGANATLMPVSTFRDDIEAGRLDAFPIIDASVKRMLVLTTLSANRSNAVETVADVVRQEIASLSEAGVFGALPRADVTLRPAPDPRPAAKRAGTRSRARTKSAQGSRATR